MTALFSPTWPRRRRPVSVASLLRADAEVVPFRGREDELADLAQWCDSAEEFDVRLLVGPGGQGKTRLGRQLVHLRAGVGWAAGFLAADPPGQPLDLTAIADTATPTLLVVDYAETRTDQLARLLHTLEDAADVGPVRILLLARSAGQWWDKLRQRHSGMLGTASVSVLPTLDDSLAARQDAFDNAIESFAQALSNADPLSDADPDTNWQDLADSVTAPEDIDAERYGTPLTLQMTALIALLDNASARTTASQRVTLLALDAADGAYQQLVEAGHDGYKQNLAEIRLRRAEVLVARGSHTVGLAASKDALMLYRQLAQKNPAFRAPLANALRVHAATLTAVEQRDEALSAAEESVGIYRTLSQDGADAHRRDLERALNTLSNARRAAGLSEEVGAPELHISDLAVGSSGIRRVEVMWQDGAARRVAAAEFGDVSDARDGELIRWYLEDYAEFPADPAPEIARDAEARLARRRRFVPACVLQPGCGGDLGAGAEPPGPGAGRGRRRPGRRAGAGVGADA